MTTGWASTPSWRPSSGTGRRGYPSPSQADHHRLLTAHLDGLMAQAEAKVLEPAGATRPVPEAPRVGSPVAARLRAFGTPAIDPRVVAR